jgi:peptidoglycan/LPS O-acetylase OafA/YrhL
MAEGETAAAPAEQRQHLHALDGLRGIAAVAVVLYHSSLVFPSGIDTIFGLSLRSPANTLAWLLAFPIRVATCGPQAVVLFFVLSGFVLSRAIANAHYESYGQYAIKRFFRIWPCFAVAILLSALLSRLIGHQPVPDASAWFHTIWKLGGTKGNVWRHLLMTETRVDLDNAMWSLIHELRISFLFPLLLLFARRDALFACAASIAILLLSCWVAPSFDRYVIAESYVGTLDYIFLFVFGIALNLIAPDARMPARGGWLWPTLAILVSLVLLICGPDDTAQIRSIVDGLRLLVCGIGASGLILVALTSDYRRILSSRFARYLGRISYSLYLIHIVVLAAVVNGLSGRLPLAVCAAIALAMMLPLADLYQRLVEGPTARAGRRIASALDRAPAPLA